MPAAALHRAARIADCAVNLVGVESATAATLGNATFTDANSSAPTSDFTTSINWGDGSSADTTSGTVSGNSGTYSVSGTHMYAEEGTYRFTITVTDKGGQTATITGIATVGDAALTDATSTSTLQATVGMSTGSQVVATFTDSNPSATAADFPSANLVITWGDGGRTSASTVQFVSANATISTWNVLDSHTYTAGGIFNVSVAVTDVGGSTITANGTRFNLGDSIGELKVITSGSNVGIWLYNPELSSSWQQLSSASGVNAAVLNPNGMDVVAQFTSGGIWRWEALAGWLQLSSASSASDLGINNDGDVAAFFSGSGIWRFEDATGWRQLSQSGSPSFLSLNNRGDVLAELPSGGLWRYEDSTGWQALAPDAANQVGINDLGEVFGVYSDGIWRYEDSTGWLQITSATNFSELSMNNRGDFAAFFTGSGIWRYEDSIGWQQLSSSAAPSSLTLNDEGDLLALFSGAGIWRYQDAAGWVQLTGADPLFTVFGASGDVLAEYPGSMWLYQTSTGWVQQTNSVPS